MESFWKELLLENDNFCKWFWTDPNGNKLIHELNKSKHRSPETDFVSLGKRPHVYAVVLNNSCLDLKDGQTKWKFCRIGLTEVDTTNGTGKQMEKAMKKIDNSYPSGSTAERLLEPLLIDPTDTRSIQDVENCIRDAFGHKVPKKKANNLKFPVPTEWVITTQDFINKVKKEFGGMSKRYGYATTTDFSENFKFQSDKHPLPAALDKLCLPSQKEFADPMREKTPPAGGAMGLDDSMSELGLEDSTMSP